jgi:hypothetical protein
VNSCLNLSLSSLCFRYSYLLSNFYPVLVNLCAYKDFVLASLFCFSFVGFYQRIAARLMKMNENLSNTSTIKDSITSKSPVWQYFKRVQINGVYRAQCLIAQCPTTLSIPNGSTSSLFKHLKNIHKITTLKKKFNGRVIEGRVVPKLTKEKKKTLDHLALAAIVKDGRSFNDFHKSGIKRFLDAAIPGNKEIIFYFFYYFSLC